MGRLYVQYIDDDEGLVLCNKCNIHLVEKKHINPIIGLELSTTYKLPINVHLVTNEQLVAYNPHNYRFKDIICNRCDNEIGWTIEYPSSYGYKELIFLLNESLL